MALPGIPVFPGRYGVSWGKDGDTEVTPDMVAAPIVDLRKALETPYDGDAHGAAYYLIGEKDCVRLNKDSEQIDDVRGHIRMVALFVDLDRPEHKSWEEAYGKKAQAEALAAVDILRVLLPNAALYSTRKGIRAVFILQTPLPPRAFASYATRVLNVVRNIVDGAALALEVDNTCVEWTRTFRMPDVMRDGVRTSTECTYVLHIPPFWGPLIVGEHNAADATIKPMEPLLSNNVFDAPDPLEIEDDAWAEFVEKYAEPIARRYPEFNGLIGKLRDGVPFFAKGARNVTTYRALAAFLEVYAAVEGVEPTAEGVYSIFYAATYATQGSTPPKEAVAELWAMISRMVDGRTWAKDPVHEPLPQKEVDTAHGRVPVVAYTGGSSRYVWDDERKCFTEPISNEKSFCAAFVDRWGPTYGMQAIPADIVLYKHGTYVDNIILDLTVKAPRIERNARSRSLVLPVGRQIDVAPVYHACVAEWLDALGGRDRQGLLDWLHYFLDFSRPLCALYLSKTPGTGKGMLADALAQFFGGVHVAFEEAVHEFNGRLRSSPLIWLDEGSNTAASSKFKSLVGNGTHRVTLKHRDSETLRGYVRMLITANNPNALLLDDVVSVQDVDAIITRVRFIEVEKDPETLLNERKDEHGTDYTREWVTRPDGSPGLICEHIRWLQENHISSPRGRRFAVEGIPTAWHLRALYSGGVGAVLACIADKVAMNRAGSLAHYDRENDRVLVNVVKFLADPVIRGDLKQDGVEPQDARATLQSVCLTDVAVQENGNEYGVIPTSLIRDMPHTAYRKEATRDALRKLFGGDSPLVSK